MPDLRTSDRHRAVHLGPLLSLLLLAAPAHGIQDPAASGEIVLRDALVLPRRGPSGRGALAIDAVVSRIVAGSWTPPKAGEAPPGAGEGAETWEAVRAGSDGVLQHPELRDGYASFVFESPEERVLLLDAIGHRLAWVNGVARTGDPYENGWVVIPVPVRKGTNEILLSCSRGRVRARLLPPPSPIDFSDRDATLPDLRIGDPVDHLGAVVVRNATGDTQMGLWLFASLEGGETTSTPVPALLPTSVRKAAFRVAGAAPSAAGTRMVKLELRRGEEPSVVLAKYEVSLAVRERSERHVRTFRSAIDGSVQYFAVVPATGQSETDRPGIVLALHGASVEATGHAAAYQPKPWCHIVAPTNRRPYGFDWEDWGRLDALEVLDIAHRDLENDPARTWLTGHSMGGHGTWQLGALFPGRFAAIAPVAGWVSFASYTRPATPDPNPSIHAILRRAAGSSDTLAYSENYAQLGVFVMHGDADDNVRVEEARTMRERLGKFHADFVYREQAGAGHWWGNQCVDWPPIFDFFRRREIPKDSEALHVAFVTPNPAVSASNRWATIVQQQVPLEASRVSLAVDRQARSIRVTTENVQRLDLRLDALEPGASLSLEIDGSAVPGIAWPEGPRPVLHFVRSELGWAVAGPAPLAEKGPHRGGPFKHVFRNRMLFVYGTGGSADEKEAALAKARLDAETFWYRGNGSVDVVPDTAFDPSAEPDRNVVLYGNAETNGAWAALLGASPVQVSRGRIVVGSREIAGRDLACVFVRPRPGSDAALVGAIAGTSAEGMRISNRMPYFVSGVAYADFVAVRNEALSNGGMAIVGAGFFGNDWSLERGDFAWRD